MPSPPQPASDLGDRQTLLVAVVPRELRGAASLANAVCHEHLCKGRERERDDRRPLLPTGAVRFGAGTCGLAARLADQPRRRSSSSPRRGNAIGVPDGPRRPKRNPFGRGLLAGVGAATARWTFAGVRSHGTVDVAGVRSDVTASASRLAERRPSVGEVALSQLVRTSSEVAAAAAWRSSCEMDTSAWARLAYRNGAILRGPRRG